MSSIQLDDDGKTSWSDPSTILAAVPVVLSILVVLGYVPNTDVDTLNGLVADTVRNGFLFVTSGVALWKYFKKEEVVQVERLALKREMMRERLRENLKG